MRPLPALSVIALLGALAAAPASAQSVRGVVLDRAAGTPIAGATVRLVTRGGDPTAATVSDSAGGFLLRAGAAGRYRVQGERLGYTVATSDTVLLERGMVLEVVLRLETGAVTLDPLIVTGRPRLERLDAVGFYDRRAEFGERLQEATFLDRDEFLRYNPFRVMDIFESVRGFRIGVDRFGRRRVEGPRGCTPAIFVNGVRLAGDVGERLSTGSVAGVEVYPPGSARAGMFMLEGARCGAIAFWTR